jgi:hypothetical protein
MATRDMMKTRFNDLSQDIQQKLIMDMVETVGFVNSADLLWAKLDTSNKMKYDSELTEYYIDKMKKNKVASQSVFVSPNAAETKRKRDGNKTVRYGRELFKSSNEESSDDEVDAAKLDQHLGKQHGNVAVTIQEVEVLLKRRCVLKNDKTG